MDWQALTSAGHTVWNMHQDRQGGSAIGGEKRRPRDQWMVQPSTHLALITDEQAESILKQLEDGVLGRRLRETPLQLTGLLVTADGQPWHSDGDGSYRVGKGRRLSAARVEAAVMGVLARDLTNDDVVSQVLDQLRQLAGSSTPVDGRRAAGLEKRTAALASQIARTADLAAQVEDPAPILRRVSDLEHQRATLLAEIADLRTQQTLSATGATFTEEAVRELLLRLHDTIISATNQSETRDQARHALREVIDRIEVEPKDKSPVLTVFYAVNTGDKMASPRGFEPLLQP